MRTIKALLLGVTVSAMMATGALAVDLPPVVVVAAIPAPPPTAPTFDWTGPYAAFTAGFGWGVHRQFDDGTVPGGFGDPGDQPMGGFIAGIALGYNIHAGRSVLGLETDLSVSSIGGSFSSSSSWFCDGVDACSTNIHWLSTARVRIGVPTGSLLWFVTGGLAFAGLDTGDGPVSAGGFARFVGTKAGWTIGAGVEMAGDIVRIRAEVLHVNLGTLSTGLGGANYGVTTNFSVVRFGLSIPL